MTPDGEGTLKTLVVTSRVS